MKRLLSIRLALCCVLIMPSLGGCTSGWCLGAGETETRVEAVGHVADSGLRVRTRNGSVTVRRDDRTDVQITAKLRAVNLERLAETKIVARRDNDGTLDIYVDWPGDQPKNNEACSFQLLMPDAGRIDITSSNGSLHIEDLGDEVVLVSSNGAIQVAGVKGPVHARTSNGAIKIAAALGPIEAKTSNGSINARRMAGPFDLRTTNGGITIDLAPDFAGEIDLHTSNAKLDVSGLDNARLISSGKDSMRLSLGDQDTVSTANTTNGRILVTKAED